MKKIFVTLLCFGISLALIGCEQKNKVQLDPKNPVVLHFSTYYNDTHLAEIQHMVREFNEGVGSEKGIYVEIIASGSISETNKMLLDSANNEPGSIEFPDIFITYKGVVLELRNTKPVIDYRDYFTDEELSAYLPNLIEIGKFEDENGKISMLPMGSATSISYLNKTDFESAAAQIGASYEDLKTFEGILDVAEKYYEYTDSLTEKPHDGKAFLGIDAPVGQVFSIYKSMGTDILEYKNGKPSINFDKEFARKMWDTFYVPTLKGYFAKNGKFSSEDFRTGKVLMSCATTAGAAFYPTVIVREDGSEHPIEILTLFNPSFEGYTPLSVQQGGGIFIAKNTPTREYASAEFVKWLTNRDNNFLFSLRSSYIPVRSDNTNTEFILEALEKDHVDSRIASSIITSIEQTKARESYIPPSIEGYENIRSTVDRIFAQEAQNKRTELLARVQNGADYDALIAEATDDQSFDQWYVHVMQELKASL